MTVGEDERMGPDSRKIRALHDVAVDLVACETDQDVFQRAVEAAADLLEFEQSAVYVREGDRLVPVIITDSSVIPKEEAETFDVDAGAIGHAYRTGESLLIEDAREHDIAEPSFPEIRSGICVPLGEIGVFNAISDTPGAFGPEDLALAEILAAHVTTTVQRIRSEAETRRQKRELERKSERLEEFASILSHDLRNPLSVARGYLEILSDTATDEQATAVGKVETALDRMEALIEDLLVVSREGWDVETRWRLDGHQVVEDAWASVATGAATLECDWTGTVEADRDRLRQAFENLFRNAIDHAGPEVTVRVGPLADEPGVYVADDGPGIDPEDRDTVFEMGVSGDGGTGLGLAIVERIVSAHGWSIRATESESGGARFEIRFDRTEDETPSGAE